MNNGPIHRPPIIPMQNQATQLIPTVDIDTQAYPLVEPTSHKKPKRRFTLALVLIMAGTMLVFTATAVTFGMYITNTGPLKDSGIKGCEQIAAKKNPVKGDNSTSSKMTATEYKSIRDIFNNSRYDDLRQAGTKFIDLLWQISNMPEDAGFAALGLIGPLYADYGALSGACANRGVVIPPLPSN